MTTNTTSIDHASELRCMLMRAIDLLEQSALAMFDMPEVAGGYDTERLQGEIWDLVDEYRFADPAVTTPKWVRCFDALISSMPSL